MKRKLLAIVLMLPFVVSIVSIVFYICKIIIKVTDREMFFSMLMVFFSLFKMVTICFVIFIIVYCFVIGFKMLKR